MDPILKEVKGAVSFASGIAVHAHREEDHDVHLHHPMHIAHKYGLLLNEDKCDLRAESIIFIGCLYDCKEVFPGSSQGSCHC